MIKGLYPVLVAGRRMRISAHALKRYRERVRPGFEDAELVGEVLRVLRFAEFGEAPDWAAEFPTESVWVRLGDDIAFPARAGVLVSCITRGGVGADLRVVRREHRQQREKRPAKPHGKRQREERRRLRDARAAQW